MMAANGKMPIIKYKCYNRKYSYNVDLHACTCTQNPIQKFKKKIQATRGSPTNYLNNFQILGLN